jgi:hypothetical protein
MAPDNGMATPVPVVNPEVKVFWDATAEGRLLLPAHVLPGLRLPEDRLGASVR